MTLVLKRRELFIKVYPNLCQITMMDTNMADNAKIPHHSQHRPLIRSMPPTLQNPLIQQAETEELVRRAEEELVTGELEELSNEVWFGNTLDGKFK